MERKHKRVILFDFLIPVAILMVLTIVFWVTDLDVAIQKKFFVQGEGWVYKNLLPWRFLYDYGTLPAIVLAAVSLLAFIGSFRIRKIAPYRRVFVFFVVLMVIGPGLIVNTIFKGHWGRPRPRHIEVFGGSEPFLYVWQKGKTGEGRSFPSGHASMGFFLFAPYFILRKRAKNWSVIFLTIGLSAGIIIGLARMVQGGHFASDVIWSGGFVYLCGIGLYYLLRLDCVRSLET
jgi:lipid A 4'-phosphatase